MCGVLLCEWCVWGGCSCVSGVCGGCSCVSGVCGGGGVL